jgi:tetratricopeptide (TPR) repeat protein
MKRFVLAAVFCCRLARRGPVLVLFLVLGGCGNAQTATSPSTDDFEKGVEALDKGDNDLAITCFDAALRRDPRDAAAYHQRGVAYFRKQVYDKSIKDFTEAIRLDPKIDNAYISRGVAYYWSKETDKAIADYSEGLQRDPKSVNAYIFRGLAHLKKRDNRKAIRDCTEALRLDPRNPSAHTTRGMGYADEGEYEKAIQDYTAALRLNAKYSQAYFKLAWLYATCPKDKLRHAEKSLAYARKARELLGREDPHILEALAAAHAENGQFEEAVRWQKKALEQQQYEAEEADDARLRLRLYQAKKPYRDLERSFFSAPPPQ